MKNENKEKSNISSIMKCMPVVFGNTKDLLSAHKQSPISTTSTCSLFNEKLTENEVIKKWESGVHLFQYEK